MRTRASDRAFDKTPLNTPGNPACSNKGIGKSAVIARSAAASFNITEEKRHREDEDDDEYKDD